LSSSVGGESGFWGFGRTGRSGRGHCGGGVTNRDSPNGSVGFVAERKDGVKWSKPQYQRGTTRKKRVPRAKPWMRNLGKKKDKRPWEKVGTKEFTDCIVGGEGEKKKTGGRGPLEKVVEKDATLLKNKVTFKGKVSNLKSFWAVQTTPVAEGGTEKKTKAGGEDRS